MTSHTTGTRKPCCQDPANIYQRAEEQRADLRVDRCRVCECRHFRVTVDPVRMGMRGHDVGLTAPVVPPHLVSGRFEKA